MEFVNISHGSALDMYRWFRTHIQKKLTYRFSTSEFHAGNMDSYKNFLNWYANLFNCKLDVLVQDKNHRHTSKSVIFHVIKVESNIKLYAQIKPGIYICSPEFVFIQLALKVDFVDLVRLGFEFCGKYSYDFVKQKYIAVTKPLTSVKKIKRTLINLECESAQLRGIAKARKALMFIRDNSNSVQETNLYLKLCLSHKYGGFAISNMHLNQSIELSKEASAIANQKHITPDISNEKNKIAIEYDSDEFHDNQYQNRKDKQRIDAFHFEGWKVFCFVPGQVNDINAFNNLAIKILKLNGQSPRIRFNNFKQRQIQLFTQLYKC